MKDFAGRARNRKLKPEEYTGGSAAVSNMGMMNVKSFAAIVNPPQAAILAVGRITDRVVALQGQPVVRPMLILNLTCDHRVVDGARGAEYLATLTSLIEEPLGLFT